ncbi:hypothetical protein CDAR_108871 [Caerostris darwini]|uniref:Uncharacterized protein n=1 Tax=Caerostris darwini TaxID=1538125 RepID=A0AAV4X0B5_9ARAC|nr:hypothetical protein CDAR_108871 [Caerostris darwini]
MDQGFYGFSDTFIETEQIFHVSKKGGLGKKEKEGTKNDEGCSKFKGGVCSPLNQGRRLHGRGVRNAGVGGCEEINFKNHPLPCPWRLFKSFTSSVLDPSHLSIKRAHIHPTPPTTPALNYGSVFYGFSDTL